MKALELQRVCIYPKDIQRITGKSERYGRKLLQRIRDQFSKEPHQYVSIDEFCIYTGLKEEQIKQYLTH